MKMVVGGRRNRLAVVVFGNRGRDWKVLDLEAGLRISRIAGEISARRREEGGAGDGEGHDGMEIDA